MLDYSFEVEIAADAERDFYNQVAWLEENRSIAIADQFEADFEALTERLSVNPYQWQKVMIYGRVARRAIIQSRYILLYQVIEKEKRVVVLRVRGAAEDWTNQPLP